MILQACLNGARTRAFHPALPLTVGAMVRDASACVVAGADELHVHPRTIDGTESLAAIDDTLPALREACPRILIGVSTGNWIERDRDRTLAAIASWTHVPDYASCNLVEPEAPDVMAALLARGIDIEVGLASAADAERLVGLPLAQRVFRILVEPPEQEIAAARLTAAAIMGVVRRADLACPLLLHGTDATVWPLVDDARRGGWATRIGLEDGCTMPDGGWASGNAALVSAVRHLI